MPSDWKAEPAGLLPLGFEAACYAVGKRTLLGPIDCVLDSTPGVHLVLGPNGAGKSLFLRLAHGLLQPTGGQVRWATEAAACRQRQAMVFQHPVVLRRSVRANVEYALTLRGLPGAERRRRSDEALARAGLTALATRPAPVLSGGERQRLALARAWALRPDVLFLDEPTASLDPAAAAQVEALIGDFRARGTHIVMSTHDLAQARRLGGEVLFFHRGRLLERAPAAGFFAQPATREAAAYVRGELFW
mgnify:CR=1 FL=1